MLTRKDWRPDHVLRVVTLMMVSWLVAMALTGVWSAARQEHGQSLPAIAMLVIMGLAFHGMGLGAVAWLVRSEHRTWHEAFGFDLNPKSAVRWGLIATVVGAPVIYGVHFLSAAVLRKIGIDPSPQNSIELLIQSGWASRTALGAFAIVLAPVVEELVFRGLIFPTLRDLGFPRLAWFGTAAAFGFIHGNAADFVPLSLFGLLLAWLYDRTGNLLTNIVAHAVFNMIPFLMLFLGFNLEP